jgi:hypothetical protein
MTFSLDKYIDEYIRDAEEDDKKVALHLKKIIPQTAHLDEMVLNAIIKELKREIENGKDFKAAFRTAGDKYILKGDVITAKLPRLLTRIILDETEFIEKISEERGVPSSNVEIRKTVDSGKRTEIAQLFKKMELTIGKVVFATFDENNMEVDPFVNYDIKDIVSMLALNTAYLNNRPITAVNIRYRNRDDLVKRFPVFVDAGWYDKFYPSDEDDKYGRTKSLNSSLKNMPEVVHENAILADIIEGIRFLEEKKGSGKGD